MSGKIFLDTNILIYAHDADSGDKHIIAKNIVKELWDKKNGVLSTQVLQEFYVNVTKKIPRPVAPIEAREIIRAYSSWEIRDNSIMSVIRASEIEEKYKLSFWDSLIVVAAYSAKVEKILTEDLNEGQVIEGILIENPFKTR
ncbi:MAG: PIN domain-containing protein [Thermodesulfovibrionales bacterium]